MRGDWGNNPMPVFWQAIAARTVLRRVLRRELPEGTYEKAEARLLRQYNPLCVRPSDCCSLKRKRCGFMSTSRSHAPFSVALLSTVRPLEGNRHGTCKLPGEETIYTKDSLRGTEGFLQDSAAHCIVLPKAMFCCGFLKICASQMPDILGKGGK